MKIEDTQSCTKTIKEIEHVAANFNHNRSMVYNTYVPTIKTYKPSNILPRAYVI